MEQLNFVKPAQCESGTSNCVEVAIDAKLNRIVRSSQRPGEQVMFDQTEWATFVASVQAGQTF
ncbi:DUF397 domain-containing protein [Micromonospora sp. LAH09]|uniref:DUF397 domain-containing protein n=1 Tax=Micromonospora cabrerizensis TaxID=2911213 RepID=UPI001EE7A77C|nr:DUF397 domain-containing protein [Micromonospora cabrerizensis]MCG5470915.1 DUF397 domain-containing protein [Micromonospora cabrerizensis]